MAKEPSFNRGSTNRSRLPVNRLQTWEHRFSDHLPILHFQLTDQKHLLHFSYKGQISRLIISGSYNVYEIWKNTFESFFLHSLKIRIGFNELTFLKASNEWFN